MQSINKEKVLCAAAAALLELTAYAVVADALKPDSLPAYPTARGVELHAGGDPVIEPQGFALFWNFGPRNPFQPVIDPYETAHLEQQDADNALAQDDGDRGGRDEDTDEAGVEHRNQQREDEIKVEAEEGVDLAEKGFEMPLGLKGTIEVGDRERWAVLEDLATGSLTRCIIGDTLCGMTVMGISPTSVVVQDRSGDLHALLDAFRRKYD